MSKESIAVITGGANGVGAASARRLAKEGHGVAILDVNDAGGDQVVADLRAEGANARYYHCDVSDESLVDRIAGTVERDMGEVDRLVTSAALIPDTESIMDMNMQKHDRMWDVNYNGTLLACRSFGRRMIQRRRGAMVTVGSINSLLPMPLPAYNPGKVAISRLTQLLATELGRHSIRVNCVAPTYVMTPALKKRVESGLRDMKKILEVHALDRIPTPEDVADVIAFLCSDQSRMVTGALLPVDAGWHGGVSYLTYAGGVPWSRE